METNLCSRRSFCRTSLLGTGGFLFLPYLSAYAREPLGNVNRAILTKLNIQPLFCGIVHNSIYEGPCRTGSPSLSEFTPSKDRQKNISKTGELKAQLAGSDFASNISMADPIYFEYDDTWIIKESEFAKLDSTQADVFLFASGTGIQQVPAVEIGRRFKKPVIFLGEGGSGNFPRGVDAVSHLRALGREGYVVYSLEELDELFHLLQVRKAIQNTRILRIFDYSVDHVNGNFINVDHLDQKFGVRTIDLRIDQMVEEFDRIASDTRMLKEAARITDELTSKGKVYMSNEMIRQSVIFYLAAQSLMIKNICNAFTINCFEMCPDKRLAYERKSTPCLAHTLLRDMGIPSACEADMNLMMTVMTGAYLAKRSMFMGNLFVKDLSRNILMILHDVPGLKMKGFDQPDLPYELRNFTYSGFGVTVRYDFNRDIGHPVTIARFDPTGKKLLVTSGEIAGGDGMNTIGCSLKAFIKVRDLDDFRHKAIDFGNHSIMLYGSYTGQFKKLGEIMDFEVVEA